MSVSEAARLFAYSIRDLDRSWSWRVYDVNGRVVAEGETTSKSEAQGAIAAVYGGLGVSGADLGAAWPN
jgi:uncharacterized protein YegP (UPF0339 family)